MQSKLLPEGLKLDLLVVTMLPLLGIGLYVLLAELGKLQLPSLLGGMLIFLPSVIYMFARKPKPTKKIMLATVIFGGLFGFFFDFIQEYNDAYNVISTFLLNIGPLPLDNVFGHMTMALITFTFYEHFLVKNTNRHISHRAKIIFVAAALINITIVCLYLVTPDVLTINYSYVLFGTIAIVPVVLLAWRRPQHLSSLIMIAPYFFILYFLTEIVAVHYNWWNYPSGQFIGYVEMGQTIRYPLEELLFWMLLYAAALISYYKIFIDRKT